MVREITGKLAGLNQDSANLPGEWGQGEIFDNLAGISQDIAHFPETWNIGSVAAVPEFPDLKFRARARRLPAFSAVTVKAAR